jgi:hypothetical protein
VYSKKGNGHQGFVVQCSNKQKQTIARLSQKFFKVLKALDRLCKFKIYLLKPSRKYQYEKEIAVGLIDRALSYILTSSIFSIRDMIRNEQNNLFRLIVPNKDYAQQVKFDFQLEFDHNGGIIPNPSFDEYTIHIMNLYDSIRKIVSTEKLVEEFLFDITSITKEELGKRTGYCINPIDFIKRNSF